jgi:glycosyltransferase involved in cell wall biosynthesis
LTGLSETEGVEVSFLPVNPRLPWPLQLLRRIKYVRTVVTSIAYLGSLPPRLLRTDVVVAFSAGYWSFLLAPVPAILLGRLLGRRVILYYHTGEAEDHLRRHGWFAKPLMRLAHRVVVPSDFLVEVFARYGLVSISVANFIEINTMPFRERTILAPRFLSNRNLEELYNVPCTLRAFAAIQKELPNAVLIVAGSGSQEQMLRRMVKSLGLDNVSFVGSVPPEQMGSLYDAADIYLNSPNIDNMPLSIIEALACGLPVVSTDAGGIPFVIRNEVNGLLVERNDDVGMAAAALRLLREPDLATCLTTTARAEVVERYSWEAVGPQWHRVCRDLLGLTGPTR